MQEAPAFADVRLHAEQPESRRNRRALAAAFVVHALIAGELVVLQQVVRGEHARALVLVGYDDDPARLFGVFRGERRQRFLDGRAAVRCGVDVLHHLAVALHVDAVLVREHARDLAFRQPSEHPLGEPVVIPLVLHHHVEREDAGAARRAVFLAEVIVEIGKAQHVPGFVDDRLRRPRLVARVRQRHAVPQPHGSVRVLGRFRAEHLLVAPPHAAPTGVGPGEVQVDGVDAPVAVRVEASEVGLFVEVGERFAEQRPDVRRVVGALVLRLVVERLAGDGELAVGCALIVVVQVFVGEGAGARQGGFAFAARADERLQACRPRRMSDRGTTRAAPARALCPQGPCRCRRRARRSWRCRCWPARARWPVARALRTARRCPGSPGTRSALQACRPRRTPRTARRSPRTARRVARQRTPAPARTERAEPPAKPRQIE